MTTRKLQCALVGMHFRPPAKALVPMLRRGTKLDLRREPDNQYDAAAVQVWLLGQELYAGCLADITSEFESEIEGMGFTIDEIMDADGWFLGYLAASEKLIEPGQSKNSFVAE